MSTPVTPSTPSGLKLTPERRLELRSLNLAAKKIRLNIDDLTSLDVSLKKNTAFIKRLKTITSDNFESICAELMTLKLTKYVDEAVLAILENRFRTAGDFAAVVEVISTFYQRYFNFPGSFLAALNKEIETPETVPEEKASWLVRQRQLLRLQAELLLVGIVENPGIILRNLQRLLPEDEVNASLHLPIATSFVKTIGPYFLKMDAIDDYSFSSFLDEDWRKKFAVVITSYFKALCRLLVKNYQKLKTLQANSRFHYENRGDLTIKQATQLQESMEGVEKLRTNLQSLADLLNLSLPELGAEVDNLAIIEGKIVFADPSISRKETKTLIYDSEEDRSFYEDIIDLKDFMPELLLCSPGDSDSGTTSAAIELNPDDIISKVAEIDPESVIGKKIDESLSAEDKSKAQLISAFFEKLPTMRSRHLTDQIAINYCYIHSRAMQKRLADTLIDLPYRRLDLLPFIGRFLATLKPYFPEIVNLVNSSMIGQFTFLFHQKAPIVGTRSRICRFIGEITKFGIMPQTTTYALLKRTILDDLTNYNIDMTAIVLESCGRYLYHQPESHKRLNNLFEIIRKKQMQGMGTSHITMLENAIYMCDPSAIVVTEPKKPKSDRLTYLFKLIRIDLHSDNVGETFQQLLRFPWNDHECRLELMRALVKAWKVRYNCIAPLANIILLIQPYYPEFVIDMVDRLIEEIRFCLEMNMTKFNQRLLASIRYLCELAKASIVTIEVVLWILQFLIIHGHEGLPRVPFPSPIDPPSNHFRIRAICLLLQICATQLKSHQPHLSHILALFEYYIATKTILSMDIDYLLDDTFEELDYKRNSIDLKGAIDRLVELSNDQLSFLREDLYQNLFPLDSFGEDESTSMIANPNQNDEFDKALTGMVSLGLEERKLERRVGAFDTPIPFSLASCQTRVSLSSSPQTLRLLVKKRNKVSIRDLAVSPDRVSFASDRGISPISSGSLESSISAGKKKSNKLTIQLSGHRRQG